MCDKWLSQETCDKGVKSKKAAYILIVRIQIMGAKLGEMPCQAAGEISLAIGLRLPHVAVVKRKGCEWKFRQG